MQSYHVLRDFAQNGKIYRQGDTVELSERQARYLLINGTVTGTKTSAAASKAARKRVSANAGPTKKSRPRKKSTKKAS